MIEFSAMFPVMVAVDLEKIKTFYETFFGFQSVYYQQDFYLHLVSMDTGVQLGFLVPDHPSQPEFLHRLFDPQGYVISLEVPNAVAAYEQAQSLNMTFSMPLKEEEWGQIHFMVEDPAGINIDIVQHKADTE
ncbi:VOC family protein [Vibrio genomosp. F10]|uniref:Glyoxalase n=2 Tax=Vibrio genomosp. F10 TaxID=723171 RepID=A0A1B9R0J0_9VIBR|nr:VOC family protein [Vibrio genomosp. F10]OCH77461.1 glyoxalase [Vibrio genomosp. F10]OEE30814.1 glyoxalase [Vibrio genomosp. F10 str. ZF-129]OEF05374.1 glyoxalase [Vibrio genomosp. F10 str. 9ZB36]